MDARQYGAVVWRRKWVILTTTTMAVLIALIITLLMPINYTATTTIRIATTTIGPALDQRAFDMSYTDRLMNTYSKLANSGPILAQLMQKLNLIQPPAVHVDIPANTELMRLSVEGDDSAGAAVAANTLAQLLIDDFKASYSQIGKAADQTLNAQLNQAKGEVDLARRTYDALLVQVPPNPERISAARTTLQAREDTYDRLLAQYQQATLLQATQANTISVADPAIPPLYPSKPNIALNLGLGLLVGLIGGAGLAFLFENLDSTLTTTEQIVETIQATPIGWIPQVRGRGRSVFFSSHTPEGEALARLRTNIAHHDHSLPPTRLLVTSAESGDGKSTIAANLARTLAQAGRGVVLVDADLRMPALHRIFSIPNARGLSDILQRRATPDDVMQYTRVPGVWLIPSGPVPANPAELIGSTQMQALLEQLTVRFDTVLLDTPPFLPVTDAALLAPQVDQVLLIVARAHSRREPVRAAFQQLQDLQTRSVDVVVNHAEPGEAYGYYAYRARETDES
ncbi:MAG: polysaccharide biosynthesis tyrosine autokinase [Chloroflexi bacterium]|nr:polysaccharide biosynthesis tyrosine autokinase [Chloroflexota bacterium]